jgi:two-component system LytT family response regulator
MRVVIVDDEPVARRGLRNLLLAHRDVVVIGEARNGGEAVRALSTLAPDLVLLDIQMPGGDAFDVLRRVASPLPAVIFVTAYDAYAVRAFDTHALDYLVKPVREDRFREAIERARHRMRSAAALDQADRLARLLAAGETPLLDSTALPAQRLVVPNAGGELILDTADILWIEADDYYAAVHAHGRRHLVRESLDSLERRLDPRRFVRVHRSAIVNLTCVREVRRTTRRAAVVLADGTAVPLSRRRRTAVADALRRLGARSD